MTDSTAPRASRPVPGTRRAFDGVEFRSVSTVTEGLQEDGSRMHEYGWLDWGRDYYAAVTFSGAGLYPTFTLTARGTVPSPTTRQRVPVALEALRRLGVEPPDLATVSPSPANRNGVAVGRSRSAESSSVVSLLTTARAYAAPPRCVARGHGPP